MAQVKDVEFDELFNYVKTEILGYTDEKMPKDMTLRLIGLRQGKFYANNKTKAEANYDYKLILTTFKVCKSDIIKALQSVEIADERHRINLIMKIVEGQINTVKARIEAKKRSEEKLLNTDLSHQNHEQSTYTKKSKKTNDKLKDLW